jgi:hypothetical protein
MNHIDTGIPIFVNNKRDIIRIADVRLCILDDVYPFVFVGRLAAVFDVVGVGIEGDGISDCGVSIFGIPIHFVHALSKHTLINLQLICIDEDGHRLEVEDPIVFDIECFFR